MCLKAAFAMADPSLTEITYCTLEGMQIWKLIQINLIFIDYTPFNPTSFANVKQTIEYTVKI